MHAAAQGLRKVGQTLALSVGVLGAVALVGYLYGFQGFYDFGGTTSMAVHTAGLFVVLGIGLIFAQTDGMAGLLLGPAPGAQLARRLLPAILLLPPLLGWLIDHGVHRGWYSDPAGTAIFAVSMMLLFATLLYRAVSALAVVDRKQRRVEEHLRNQAELMNLAADALIVRELGGPIRFWNRGAEALYGWPAMEAIGQNLHRLLQTEGLPPEIETLLAQRGCWEGELRQTTRSGAGIRVENRKTAMRAEGGQMLVLESNRDITGRRTAEQEAARLHAALESHVAKIEQTNERLHNARRAALNLMEDALEAREQADQLNRQLQILQEKEKVDAIRLARTQSAANTICAMQEGVVLLEQDGTIVFANPAAERLTGLSGSEIVGKNISTLLSMFLTDLDLEIAQQGMELLRGGKTPEFLPLQFRHEDGQVRQILPSVSVMDALEAVGRKTAVLTLKDVTALHEAVCLREEGERKYRELVENANSIIMRITPDHRIQFFNEYAQQFFGYEPSEVLGRRLWGTILPADNSAGGDPAQMLRASSEIENICKDGRRVWVHWANRDVCDPQGNVLEILCVGTDITQRREMEKIALQYQERLRELAERLAVAEEEDRWRISRYIHDTIVQNLSLSCIRIGSILMPMRAAKLMEESAALVKIRESISQAMDECRMVMSDLTPELLYELGLLPALTDLAKKLAEKHGARIVVEPEEREAMVSRVLRGMLFESVRELIMNALKYAGPCEIRVAVRAEEHELVLRVADNGRGFASPGATAPAGKKGGFGLLNIRQRVEGLGGRLEIVSVPGQGTTATSRMPLGDGGERTDSPSDVTSS